MPDTFLENYSGSSGSIVNNHTHIIGDVVGLQIALNGKADTSHTHSDKLSTSGGTMSGAIAMGSQKITGLANGTDNNDAVNKSQLDTKLNLAGGTMSGAIAMGSQKITGLANGTDSNDAVNKSQLDTKLNLAGGTMSGAIAMGSQKITGLANGTDNNDAVNKSQLDTKLNLAGGQTITGNLTIGGDLTLTGTASYVNTTNLAVSDPLTRVANTNTSDIVDIGMYGVYNSSTFTGIFRDATDNKYKFFNGLTVEPSTTVNTGGSGYTKSDVVVGDLNAVSITSDGNTDFTITKNGTSSKLIIDSNGTTSEAIKIISDGGIDCNHFTGQYTVFKENNTSCAAFGINTFVTSSNVPYVITHQTNAGSQDLKIWKNGSDSSKILLESDGTGTDSIQLKSNSGGIMLECPTISNISINSPLTLAGVGLHANGINSYTSIDVNGDISITKNTRIIKIASGTSLYSITPSSSLTNQQIIVFNDQSAVTVNIAHNNMAYGIVCYWLQLLPKTSIELVWNTDRWYVYNALPQFHTLRSFQWRGDSDLKLFCNTGLTIHAALNFLGANTTGGNSINGVTFDVPGANTTSGTNWLRTELTSTFTEYTTQGDNFTTDHPQSYKLRFLVYQFDNVTFRFDNLTIGRIYMLVIPGQNTNNSILPCKMTDIIKAETIHLFTQGQYQNYEGSVSGPNSAGTFNTYIFRADNNTTTYSFKFTESLSGFINLYGLWLIAL